MPEPLDLRELDAALANLESGLSGRSLQDLMLDVGGVLQSQWRDNVLAVDEIETGAYLGSIETSVRKSTDTFIQVQVGTDVRAKDGVPYPAVLEFGDNHIRARPIGKRAVELARRRITSEVSTQLERKVRSRLRK